MPIYLDHSATHQIWPDVRAKLAFDLDHCFANPSSVHRLGRSAEKLIETSRRQMAGLLSCQPNEMLLTSGGSESINLAIKGFIEANPRLGCRIIISQGEHAATTATTAWLRQKGCDIHQLPLQADGCVDLPELAKALKQPAALISLIHVSNETGAVNDIREIVRLRDQIQPQTAIHLDAVQTVGRLPMDFKATGVDLLSGSGHKIGAPKGIGWLLIRQGIRLAPQIHGGGQQRGLRAGTENPPLVAALSGAMRLATADLAARTEQVRQLSKQLQEHLTAEKINYKILSPENGVPHILMIAFPGLRGETLLHALEDREIYVSTGAACSSRRKNINPVLQAMRVPAEQADCAIRISLNADNTAEEMLETALAIADSCRRLIRA